MKTITIALVVAGLSLAGIGGEGLVQAARNRQQTTTTCEDIATLPPGTLWLRATGCDLDYAAPSVRDPGGRIVEMFFPVRPSGRPPTSSPALVVATRDPEALAIAQQTIGEGRQPDQEALTVMGLRIVTALDASREVEGFVRSGVLVTLRSAIVRRGRRPTADPSVVVLDLHARPPVAAPAVVAGLGLAALVAAALLTARGRVRVPAPPAHAEAAAPPVAEPEPDPLTPFAAIDVAREAPAPPSDPLTTFEPKPALEPALPAMLLLNLDSHAGPEAIEGAPALGTWDDVARAIASAHAGLAFDEQGRAVVEARDSSMILELGPRGSSPVWTVTVRSRGPAATEAVQTLAARTHWRAFVPRTGVFLPVLNGEDLPGPNGQDLSVRDGEVASTASGAHVG